MKRYKTLLFCVSIEIAIIVSIAFACLYQGIVYALFYNVIYGLILSVCVPLYIMSKTREPLSSVGIKRIGRKQVIVLISFVTFSIGGQIIPKIVANELIAWELLPVCIAPLLMTTFFEEFLFRGFIQTRVEKSFGSLIAILVSGIMFSLYHIGYTGFRTMEDLLLLFAVGLGFAIAFKLSDNNLFVAYFVNLPNAFITYLLKSGQFPALYISSTIYAVISIVFIVIIILVYTKKVLMRNVH